MFQNSTQFTRTLLSTLMPLMSNQVAHGAHSMPLTYSLCAHKKTNSRGKLTTGQKPRRKGRIIISLIKKDKKKTRFSVWCLSGQCKTPLKMCSCAVPVFYIQFFLRDRDQAEEAPLGGVFSGLQEVLAMEMALRPQSLLCPRSRLKVVIRPASSASGGGLAQV